MQTLLQISWRVRQWKNYENRPTSDEGIVKIKRCAFFWDTVYFRLGEMASCFHKFTQWAIFTQRRLAMKFNSFVLTYLLAYYWLEGWLGSVMVRAFDLQSREFDHRPWRYRVTTLGKLLTPMCRSLSSIIWYRRWAVSLFGWEGSRGPGGK